VITPIQAARNANVQPGALKHPDRTSPASFGEELARASGESRAIHFSAHARKRLADRSIALSDADQARIAQSADLAAAKGAREALVLMDRLALVVGVPSRTVITVIEPQDGSPAVFTHIDSVVMAPRSGD
jgi:flagellar operon protein